MTYEAIEALLKRRLITALALLVVVTALAYGGSLKNGFVWDDHYIVEQYPLNRNLGNLPQFFLLSDSISGWAAAPYYRPLARATYAFDYRMFGLNPWGYHLVNFLVHLANVLLLFFVARALFKEVLPALLAAAIFAVHAGAAEPVFAIFARNSLMALFFMLATFLAFRRGMPTGRSRWLIPAAFLFLLGLLSKETVLMLLPVLAWYCRTEKIPVKGMILRLLPLLAAAAVYLLLRRNALSEVLPALQPETVGARLATTIYLIPRYLLLLVWPARLTVLHEIPTQLQAWFPYLLACCLVLLAGIVAVARYGGKPLKFGLLWGVCALAPVIGFIATPGAPLAERHLYAPLAGFALVIAGLAVALLRRSRAAGVGVIGIMLLLLTARTAERGSDWRSDVTLFQSALTVNPSSSTAHFNLGNAYQGDANTAAAIREWQIVIRIEPRAQDALNQLGKQLILDGRSLEALICFERAVAAHPESFESLNNLAVAQDLLDRSAEAIASYQRALALVPPERLDAVPRLRQRIELLRTRAAKP